DGGRRNPDVAALLQWRGSHSQHRRGIVPFQSGCRRVPVRKSRIFRTGERSRSRGSAGQILTAMVRLLFALLLVLTAGPVLAREEIRQFDVTFEVAADGSVTITEAITVNAEGNSIRRGIFRDVPTRLATPDGRTIRLPFEVISVTRNGASEPYEVEGIDGGQRIRIGSADALLRPGIHEYQITYRMGRAARMFADHDEFYWNATGNYWDFPIVRASALVVLPEGANITELNAYTGEFGVRSSDNSAVRI